MRRWLQCPSRPRRCRRLQKSFDRYPDEPEDYALGRSKGGFGTKFHVVTDGNGTPLVAEITAGQVSEATQAQAVIEAATATKMGRRRKKSGRRCVPKKMAGDKAYSMKSLRQWLKERKIKPVIPHKSNEKASRDKRRKVDVGAYRDRSAVEQCVGWLKEYRRIGTRFEKLAVQFQGMLQLVIIDRYFRLLS